MTALAAHRSRDSLRGLCGELAVCLTPGSRLSLPDREDDPWRHVCRVQPSRMPTVSPGSCGQPLRHGVSWDVLKPTCAPYSPSGAISMRARQHPVPQIKPQRCPGSISPCGLEGTPPLSVVDTLRPASTRHSSPHRGDDKSDVKDMWPTSHSISVRIGGWVAGVMLVA